MMAHTWGHQSQAQRGPDGQTCWGGVVLWLFFLLYYFSTTPTLLEREKEIAGKLLVAGEKSLGRTLRSWWSARWFRRLLFPGLYTPPDYWCIKVKSSKFSFQLRSCGWVLSRLCMVMVPPWYCEYFYIAIYILYLNGTLWPALGNVNWQ